MHRGKQMKDYVWHMWEIDWGKEFVNFGVRKMINMEAYILIN